MRLPCNCCAPLGEEDLSSGDESAANELFLLKGYSYVSDRKKASYDSDRRHHRRFGSSIKDSYCFLPMKATSGHDLALFSQSMTISYSNSSLVEFAPQYLDALDAGQGPCRNECGIKLLKKSIQIAVQELTEVETKEGRIDLRYVCAPRHGDLLSLMVFGATILKWMDSVRFRFQTSRFDYDDGGIFVISSSDHIGGGVTAGALGQEERAFLENTLLLLLVAWERMQGCSRRDLWMANNEVVFIESSRKLIDIGDITTSNLTETKLAAVVPARRRATMPCIFIEMDAIPMAQNVCYNRQQLTHLFMKAVLAFQSCIGYNQSGRYTRIRTRPWGCGPGNNNFTLICLIQVRRRYCTFSSLATNDLI